MEHPRGLNGNLGKILGKSWEILEHQVYGVCCNWEILGKSCPAKRWIIKPCWLIAGGSWCFFPSYPQSWNVGPKNEMTWTHTHTSSLKPRFIVQGYKHWQQGFSCSQGLSSQTKSCGSVAGFTWSEQRVRSSWWQRCCSFPWCPTSHSVERFRYYLMFVPTLVV